MNHHVKLNASEWLSSQNIRMRNFNAGDHKTTCPQCSHDRRNKTDTCLSVTIHSFDDVVVHCHHCEWSAGNKTQENDRQSNRNYQPKTYSKPAPVENPQRPDSLLAWFEGRGISKTTVEAVGVHKTQHWFPQSQGEQDCIAFPYIWNGELRNVKYRSAKKDFIQEKNPQPVLYNADSIKEGCDLVICEGEIDVLSFIEAGFEHVVSLPNGAPAKVEKSDKRYEPLATHADELEKVKRIYIATDTDIPGENLANEFARRLGRDRCFRVRYDFANDVSYKDGNEVLQADGAKALADCIKTAAPWPIEGIHNVSDYFDEVMDLYDGKGPQPLSTGFAAFDKAFKVIAGQFIVVTGAPNGGKSRWVDQVAYQMADQHGWNWGVFSPETGEANHVADLTEIITRKPFHKGFSERMSRDELQAAKSWLDERISFIATTDHTPSIDWILERARALVLRAGINGLIIDPYNEIEAGRPKEMTETEFVSQLISKCKRFCKIHDVAIFMIAHPTKLRGQNHGDKTPVPGLYDISGSAHWNNKADAGLVVYRDYENKKTIVYAKKIRRQPICGSPGSVEFQFNGMERRFVELPDSYQSLS